MALILSIETSTMVCSVALHEHGELCALEERFEANSHSEVLMELIETVLATADKKQSDLSAIAVSKGPGSYTGLRIGVSIAKGLTFGLDIPLISVETLEALSLHIHEKITLQTPEKDASFFVVPMIDARRMEVYCAVFDEKQEQKVKVEAKIIDEDSYHTFLEQKDVYFAGNGADKCKGTITHLNAVFLSDVYTSAKQIGMLAWKKFQIQEFEDVAYFEPYYLKEFMTKPSKKKLL